MFHSIGCHEECGCRSRKLGFELSAAFAFACSCQSACALVSWGSFAFKIVLQDRFAMAALYLVTRLGTQLCDCHRVSRKTPAAPQLGLPLRPAPVKRRVDTNGPEDTRTSERGRCAITSGFHHDICARIGAERAVSWSCATRHLQPQRGLPSVRPPRHLGSFLLPE